MTRRGGWKVFGIDGGLVADPDHQITGEDDGTGWASSTPGGDGGGALPAGVINPMEAPYNAVGDNLTDDHSAFQNALDAIRTAKGGGLWLPPNKIFKIASQLDGDDLQSATIFGHNAGFASNDAKPVLNFTGASGSLLRLRSTLGVALRGFTCMYSNEAYTGNLITYDHSPTFGADVGRSGMSDMGFYSSTASFGAASYISINAFINGWFDRCDFQRAQRAVIYGDPSGLGGQYVVSTSMRDCSFARHVFNPVLLRGGDTENCSWDNISFEPLTSQKCGGVEQTSTVIYSPVFKNIWAGDASVAGGTLFKGLSTGANSGTFIGGRIADIGGTNSVCFDLKGGWQIIGVDIEGSTGSFIFGDPGVSDLRLCLLGGGANSTGSMWKAGGAPSGLFSRRFQGVTDAGGAIPKTVHVLTGFSPNTLGLTDGGQMVGIARGGGGVECGIPTNASIAFPVGTEIVVFQEASLGAGTVEIVPAGGVTLNPPGLTTLASQGSCTLRKVATNTWVVDGDIT